MEFAYLASQLSMGIRMSSPALPTLLSRTAGYPIEKSRAFRHILKLGIRHRSCLDAVNHKSIPLGENRDPADRRSHGQYSPLYSMPKCALGQ